MSIDSNRNPPGSKKSAELASESVVEGDGLSSKKGQGSPSESAPRRASLKSASPFRKPGLPQPGKGRRPEPSPQVGWQIKNMRLLIIDDDPARLDALAMALRGLGAEVAVGDRFESGYSQASRLLPDAVISDLAAPGQRGWLLVQRLRRHPLLRWTPVLLFKWWRRAEDGEGHVLLDRVRDRLEEVFAPLRVLGERRQAKQTLSERIDITGPAALLRFLIAERLRGMLILNDAWSIFEICIGGGKLHTVHRQGLDGSSDKGADALFQYLLSDGGRWSFRYLGQLPGDPNIGQDFDKELKKAGVLISQLFGPVQVTREGIASHIQVDTKMLESVCPTLAGTPRRVADVIRGRLDDTSLAALLEEVHDVHELSRAIQFLLRCGAVRALRKNTQYDLNTPGGMAADAVAQLLMAVSDDYRAVEESSAEFGVESMPPSDLMPLEAYTDSGVWAGRYHVAGLEPERLTSSRTEKLRLSEDVNTVSAAPPALETAELEETAALSSGNFEAHFEADPPPPPPPSSRQTIPDKNASGSLSDSFDRGFLKGMIFDSLAPTPGDGDRAKARQMWLAIGLALLLGAILVAGLVYIGAGGKSDDGVRPLITRPKSGDSRR